MKLRVWPGNPAGTQASYTLGTQFSVNTGCALVNIWWYLPPGATVLPGICGIWDIVMKALATEDVTN